MSTLGEARQPNRATMRSIILILSLVAVCEAVVTISQWPGFQDMPTCAKCPLDEFACFGNMYNQLNCNTDGCLCNRFPQALSIVMSLASASSCSAGDISSATSILSAYCRQIPSITFNFNGAPNTNGPAATAAVPTTAGVTETNPPVQTITGGISLPKLLLMIQLLLPMRRRHIRRLMDTVMFQ
jgi:hypothetical protein